MRRRYAQRKKFKTRMKKRYYAKKRFYRRIKRKIPKKVYRHGKAIRNLQKKTSSVTSHYTLRVYAAGFMVAGDNQIDYVAFNNISTGNINTLISKLPYVDPTNPNVLTVADMASVTTFSMDFTIKRAISSVQIMAN